MVWNSKDMGWSLIVIGILIIFFNSATYLEDMQENEYKPYMGTVTGTSIKEIGTKTPGLMPVIEYTFSADNRTYRATLELWENSLDRDQKDLMDSFLSKYPIGARIDVLADPSNPEHSTLKIEHDGYKPGFGQFALFFGLLFLFLGTYFLVRSKPDFAWPDFKLERQ